METAVLNTLLGEAGNDLIQGGANSDSIDGGDGNDSLLGGGGNNTILGGAGDDSIQGGGGNDSLLGGQGNDIILGIGGNNFIDGGTGINSLVGGGGNDTLTAGPREVGQTEGNSTLNGGGGFNFASYANRTGGITVNFTAANPPATPPFTGNVTLEGGIHTLINIQAVIGSSGDDSLVGTGIETLIGGAGNDIIRRGAFMDGGAGNNTIIGDFGNATILGGAGTEDTLDYSEITTAVTTSGVNVNLQSNFATFGPFSQLVTGIEVVVGTINNDTLTTGNGNESLFGGGGNDSLVATVGNNWLDGGTGNNTLRGGSGNDILRNGVYIEGGSGNDSVIGTATTSATFIGGEGSDTLSYAGITAPLQINLATSTVTRTIEEVTYTDSIREFEVIEGGEGNDTFTGGGRDITLRGGAGDDTYILSAANAGGTIIDDTQGNNQLQLQGIVLAIDSTLPGATRVLRNPGNPADLVIDLDGSGTFNPDSDLRIANFFNQEGTAQGEGFINIQQGGES
uniref:Calcium-binding protein n=1 Tax=Desertifilum tharense IPPAS B-1220 TaxID=1781255 RepID=A0ACD5GTU8_9CYAN